MVMKEMEQKHSFRLRQEQEFISGIMKIRPMQVRELFGLNYTAKPVFVRVPFSTASISKGFYMHVQDGNKIILIKGEMPKSNKTFTVYYCFRDHTRK